MAYFKDLTPYTYFHAEKNQSETVNIGWLERWHLFPKGETSEEFRLKLERLSRRRVNQTRGLHFCQFCRGREKPAGSAEIRVKGTSRIYAAPELVHHYVEAHGYKPPDEFIQAVLAWDEGAQVPPREE